MSTITGHVAGPIMTSEKWVERVHEEKARAEKAEQAAWVLRYALADMVNQHGGAETALSANEYAVEALDWTKWVDDAVEFETHPWVTPEMRLIGLRDLRETVVAAGGDPGWVDEMIEKEQPR